MPQNPHQRYWLGLHLIPQFGIAKITRLLAPFDTAEALWREPAHSLRQLDLPRPLVEEFIAGRRTIDLSREMDKVARCGANLLTIEDDAYPPLLRQVPGPPLLYFRGSLPPSDAKALAIVGTRKPSRYGENAARHLAFHIAKQDVVIVSGLAHGIDAAAHRGTLDAKGITIAIMATGIERIYPRDHRELAEQIMENGALITEMPIGTPPQGRNFPRRNRLISGIALGVLVAEAPKRSGALNTASHAGDQGRDVFAVPHSIFNKTGLGTNGLIQDGAKLVMRARDVLEELDITYQHTQVQSHAAAVQPAGDAEERIYQQLDADPLHVDEIIRRTQLPAATVIGTLTLLQLKGLAEAAGPMQYCRPHAHKTR